MALSECLDLAQYIYKGDTKKYKMFSAMVILTASALSQACSKILWKSPESVPWWYQTDKKTSELYRDDTFTILEYANVYTV